MSVSRTFRAVGACGVAALVGVAPTAAGAGGTAAYTPVIGKPVSTPAQAVAGKRFAVVFEVKRSDTGAMLTKGKIICDPSVAGKVLPMRSRSGQERRGSRPSPSRMRPQTGDGGVRGVGERHRERLARLDGLVSDHRDVDRLRELPRSP